MPKPKLLGTQTTWSVLALSVVFAVLCLTIGAKVFLTRFMIMGDIHVIKCLPYTLMVVDTWDKTAVSGEMYAFKARNTVIFPDGSILGKKLMGHMTDEIVIDQGEEILLNGTPIGYGLQKAAVLHHKRTHFMGTGYLEKDEHFALGTNQIDSIDSRYWGNVNEDQIVGRLHPLF